MNPLNCTIYASCEMTFEEFKNEIAIMLPGRWLLGSFINAEKFEIASSQNDEYDPTAQIAFPDGFLHFKFIVDVAFRDSCSLTFCVQEIGKILLGLWSKNIAAIASYDFEHLLPEKGGYKSKNVPWPTKG